MNSQKGQRGAAETVGMGGVHGTPSGDLGKYGITPSGEVYWNLAAGDLINLAVSRGEGTLSAHGALVTETGERTGRSPNDKFIVDEATVTEDINWGDVNVSTNLETFERMRAKVWITCLLKTLFLFKICIVVQTSPKLYQSASSTTTHGTTPSHETCLFDPMKPKWPITPLNSLSSTHLISKQMQSKMA